jgi:hypothetical protein
MPKLNKPSVRFAFIKKRRFPFQTVRLCLTYKGKRLYLTDESNRWYGVDPSQFNSDGTLSLKADNTNVTDYRALSEKLSLDAEAAIMIANEAEKKGVWNTLTSKDFDNLFTYGFGVPSVEGNKKSVLMTQFFRYALEEAPLSERLTAEEKEQIRFAHKAAKTFAERTNPMSAEVFKGQYLLLESIFGADFFKEGELNLIKSTICQQDIQV